MRVKGGRKRNSKLQRRQEDYDENHLLYERITGQKYHRPGSQQTERKANGRTNRRK